MYETELVYRELEAAFLAQAATFCRIDIISYHTFPTSCIIVSRLSMNNRKRGWAEACIERVPYLTCEAKIEASSKTWNALLQLAANQNMSVANT